MGEEDSPLLGSGPGGGRPLTMAERQQQAMKKRQDEWESRRGGSDALGRAAEEAKSAAPYDTDDPYGAWRGCGR